MTDTEICNQALTIIGDERIDSLGGTTSKELAANTLYAPTRDALLRAYDWPFAIRRVALAREVSTPAFTWAYQFTLPVSCLRVIDVYEDYPGQIPYVVEGRKILSDETSMSIRYIHKVVDPNEFDSTFVTAFAAKLGMFFASMLTKKTAMFEIAKAAFEMAIADAGFALTKETTYPRTSAEDLMLNR